MRNFPMKTADYIPLVKGVYEHARSWMVYLQIRHRVEVLPPEPGGGGHHAVAM